MARRKADRGKRPRKGGRGTTVLLVAILLVGVGLLAYPSFANYYNSFRQSRAIASYVEYVSSLSDEDYEAVWENALDYNQRMAEAGGAAAHSLEEQAAYDAELNITETGIMGTVEIPRINVSLPVYHGTDESVLQYYIGHIDWSSLPVGSRYADGDEAMADPLFPSHSILSGHRGLPSARLFTDLDELIEGDRFYLNILDRVLTYEVDQIRVIEPTDLSELHLEDGMDLCTLVTCTPYGINTHRLLVRGRRVPNEKKFDIRVTADVMQIEPILIAPILAAPVLLLLLIWVLLAPGDRRGKARGRRADLEKTDGTDG